MRRSRRRSPPFAAQHEPVLQRIHRIATAYGVDPWTVTQWPAERYALALACVRLDTSGDGIGR